MGRAGAVAQVAVQRPPRSARKRCKLSQLRAVYQRQPPIGYGVEAQRRFCRSVGMAVLAVAGVFTRAALTKAAFAK